MLLRLVRASVRPHTTAADVPAPIEQATGGTVPVAVLDYSKAYRLGGTKGDQVLVVPTDRCWAMYNREGSGENKWA